MKDNQEPRKQSKQQRNSNTFIRYSGLAFEMLAVMLVAVFGGIKLDEKFGTSPLLTAILSLIGVALAIYFAIREFLKK